ncbi:MAG TPA: DUF6519 domain-containing protein [Longimicrobium sp.]|nr:DUF6519 domain-containing protein [Longimicrobium sp.]
MTFDCSRFRFVPAKDYQGVVMQQGRVQLDSDWNEQAAQLDRRLRAGTLDALGPAVVPRQTPDGFRITAAGGTLSIGRGRMYVDGLLAENHGAGAAEWDPALAELRGTGPLPYTAQPYYPDPPPLPSGGRHLVYLDVWQREVTHLQDPSLVEQAVGVDTTGRLQTVWQVKVLANVGSVECGAPAVPGWDAATRPSAGRLTTGTAPVANDPDPCHVPPAGGYKGEENQLYRVEVHQEGAPGTATFKWSRDNATVASAVLNVSASRTRLVVESVGRDDVLRFHDGEWVEVTDDWRELHGLSGELRRIVSGGGVDDATRTLTLDAPLSAGLFPADAQGDTDPARHTRVRRWDQAGRVLHPDATLYQDLDAAGSTGAIRVPPGSTTDVVLEQGIVVRFDVEGTGGVFRAGDAWTFAARTPDASVEELKRAPPRAIHHHYCRLALVTFPGDATDCRIPWPAQGCCTVTVRPGDWRTRLAPYLDEDRGGSDGATDAAGAVGEKRRGGTLEVCFCAGTFDLGAPLVFRGYDVVRVTGRGEATRLVTGAETALCFDACGSVTVRGLYASSGQEARRHLGGTLTFLRCDRVEVRSVTARCAGGARRRASCLYVWNTPLRRAHVRIRRCRAEIGHGQTGFLVVNPERVMVNDNELAAWGARKVSLASRWDHDRYRAIAMGMLSTARELRALERKYERSETPQDSPAGARPRWKKLFGRLVVGRVIGSRTDNLAGDSPSESDGGDANDELVIPPVEVSAADLPQIVRRWLPADQSIRIPTSPHELPKKFQRFLREIETVASQGIVVAGIHAVDVTIARNAVHGAVQGIHVGTSDPRTSAADHAGAVTITDNLVTTSLPWDNPGDRHGIFAGNCRSVRIEGNRVSLWQVVVPRVLLRDGEDASRNDEEGEAKLARGWRRHTMEGIRVDGFLGPMVIIRNNHMEGCSTGVRFYPIKYNNPSHGRRVDLWNVAYNVAYDGDTAFDCPPNRLASVIHEYNLVRDPD